MKVKIVHKDIDCEVYVTQDRDGTINVSIWKKQNILLRRLWGLIWQRWLDDGDKVIRVSGWRSALIEGKYGRRRGLACCFWWFT